MMSFPEPSMPRRPSTSLLHLEFHPPPKRNLISYGFLDLRTGSTCPQTLSTSGFLDYVRTRGQELVSVFFLLPTLRHSFIFLIYSAMNLFDSVSAPSSSPLYNRTM